MSILRGIYYSFPCQLLILHFKKNQSLLLFWLLLFGLTSNHVGKVFGLGYLFLSPEYLSEVSNFSFFIIGVTLAGFIMTWNTSSYMLNSFRFPFLATNNKPFGHFCINNAILPILFLIWYSYLIIDFQTESELSSVKSIVSDLFGLYSGIAIWILLLSIYYLLTNKNMQKMLGRQTLRWIKHKEELRRKTHLDKLDKLKGKELPVTTFFNMRLRLRRVRAVGHYEKYMLQRVFYQNHVNAIFGQILSIFFILSLSFLIENKFFQIPAAASLIVLFTVFVGLVGAFSFWTRGWRLTFFIALILLLNFLIGTEWFSYKSKVLGLNYEKSTPYNIERLDTFYNNGRAIDIEENLQVLDAWKVRNSEKGLPKVVLVSVSGGGLRSTAWSMTVLQNLHQETGGKFMKRCHLITGASGGMIGASYFRSLYYHKGRGENIRLWSDEHYEKITKDLLNPLMFTLLVNDLVFPSQRTTYNNHRYRKDRGFIFEEAIDRHTEGRLDVPLNYFAASEQTAEVPTLVYSPTIVNDERSLILGSRGMTFLCGFDTEGIEVDGVDAYDLLGEEAGEIRTLSAIRMSATYPYILPMVHLPTDPPTQVMDAGFRDNFGTALSLRYVEVFHKWMRKNTSGVVLVQIRDTPKDNPIKEPGAKTMLWKLLKPITNLYENMGQIQDYRQDSYFHFLKEKLPIDIVRFEYEPSDLNKKASLSWHLTAREKNDIKESFFLSGNQKALEELLILLRD